MIPLNLCHSQENKSMKTQSLKMSAIVLVFTAVAAFGQQGTINSAAELRQALATAESGADHARLASYYHHTALVYAGKQAEEERIADRWQKQYANWSKSPNPYLSAKNLAAYYGQLSSDAAARAAEQDRLAKS
jgi:20S proteasome alpha/beta subunit